MKAQKLVDVTYDCLMAGIAQVRPGATLGDIGWAIQSLAESHRFSVVRDFCGHGLGRVFHAPPSVVHYGTPGEGVVLQEGMFFTIEPMINAGRPEVKVLGDGWTAVTRDKSLSAQFEHSDRRDPGRVRDLHPVAQGLHQAALPARLNLPSRPSG